MMGDIDPQSNIPCYPGKEVSKLELKVAQIPNILSSKLYCKDKQHSWFKTR